MMAAKCKSVRPTSLLQNANTVRSFVTTVSADDNKLALLRSYNNPQEPDELSPQFELWEALRATSAATTYFEEFRRGDAGYVDGAFRANNPVAHVRSEASEVWPGRPAFLLSIGTGTKPSVPLRGHALQLARTLTRLVTETEETWTNFARRHADMANDGMLFRFSAPGVGGIDLGDYRRMRDAETTTRGWLRETSVNKDVGACARRVVEVETTDYEKIDREEREREARLRDSLSAEEKECLKTLHRAAPDYESQRLAVEKPVPGTCQWFLEHTRFVEWMDTPASLLWLTANPGCGKSVLSGCVIDFFDSTYGENAIICSFFFRAGEETRRQADQALCAMLHQIFTIEPSLAKIALAAFSGKDHAAFTDNVEGLWKLVCTAARATDKKLILVIDALDECIESSRNRLCDILSSSFGPDKAPKTPANLKVFMTSRPWPTLESKLRPVSSIRIRGEDEEVAMGRDVELMIKHRVAALEQHSSLSPAASALLQKKLMRGADRTFLWVSLVLETVAQMPSRKMSAIRNMLNSVPQGLDQLYESAVSKFANPGASSMLLETLLVARRALTVAEVNIALNLSERIQSVGQLQDDIEPDAEWTIKHLGGFFVRISHSVVSLVHQTAREFLTKSAGDQQPKTGSSFINVQRANLRLAGACIRFLLLEGLPRRLGGIPSDIKLWLQSNETYLASCPNWLRGFVEYSSKSWFVHFDEDALNESTKEAHRLLPKLCDPQGQSFASWWPFYARMNWSVRLGRWLYEDGESSGYSQACRVRIDTFFAHYATQESQIAIVRGLVDAGYCRADEENETDLDLVALAAYTGNLRLVKWLLGRAESPREVAGNAFVVALSVAEKEVAEFLAKTGLVDMNTEYRAGRRESATSRALPVRFVLDTPHSPERAPVHLMTLLLDYGLTIRDEYVVEVASKGFNGILKVLIDRDSRPLEDRLVCLQQALAEATRNGWPDCVETLRQYFGGRDADATDLSSGLMTATTRCDDEAMKMLLIQGAEDADGEALRSACACAVEEMVKMLLDRHQYSQQQLNSALRAYFDMVCDADLRNYQLSKITKCLRTGGAPLFLAFPVISTFGLTATGKTAVLEMLIARGAKAPRELFVRAFSVVVAMDDDFAAFLLNRLHQLQDDESLSPGDFLTIGCFWGKAAVVRRILEDGDCVNHGGFEPTALQAAVVSGSEAVVRLVLDTEVARPDERRHDARVPELKKEISTLWSRAVEAMPAGSDLQPVGLAEQLGFANIGRRLIEGNGRVG
ncbi:hypothetical protein F5X68DRAFT_214590 [Plectosphaerella plurivora]|uniref:PNPLA domain-containing protein n=1 Tax=Plectosphaerella plurivora TaxID=936078 RepID=A0A9P8V292_9PEZI|nr:hypothetical protein F5X68DRAFT_214590 [Plectosphaerella plurivora]